MSKNHVTQRDIALAAGVTQSAVSLALRDSPRVSRQQREHILAIARQLNYQNDPLSSGLARRKNQSQLPPLAYLGTHTQRDDQYAQALASLAEQQGRSVYWVAAERQADETVYDDLQSRHIAGVLIAQATRLSNAWHTPWPNIAQVHCGLYHAPTTGDIIAHDLCAAAQQLWEHVRSLGYKHAAALMPVAGTGIVQESLSERLLLGGLLSLEAQLQHANDHSFHVTCIDKQDAVANWLRAIPAHAEVLFCYDNAALKALRQAGERRPCFVLVLDQAGNDEKGLLINYQHIMEQALFRLDQKMHQGQFGPSQHRQLTLLHMELRA